MACISAAVGLRFVTIFTASDDVSFPVTLGDFVKAYENAAA